MRNITILLYLHPGKAIEMKIRKLILLSLMLVPFFALSQEKSSPVKVNVQIGASYSYPGISTFIGTGITNRKSEYGLGVRTSVSNFSRYSNSPFVGFYLDYNRFLSEEKKWRSFVNLHYGSLFRKVNSPIDPGKAYFQIHELYFGYGMCLKFRKIAILNTFNYGGYMERNINFYKNEPSITFHPGPLVKILVSYEF